MIRSLIHNSELSLHDCCAIRLCWRGSEVEDIHKKCHVRWVQGDKSFLKIAHIHDTASSWCRAEQAWQTPIYERLFIIAALLTLFFIFIWCCFCWIILLYWSVTNFSRLEWCTQWRSSSPSQIMIFEYLPHDLDYKVKSSCSFPSQIIITPNCCYLVQQSWQWIWFYHSPTLQFQLLW